MRVRVRTLKRLLIAAGLVAGLLAVAIPALADYTGPDRDISTWTWERRECRYLAEYDEPGPGGYYSCTLRLYRTPDSNCPSSGSVGDFFNPTACVGWPGWLSCDDEDCDISRSESIDSCSEGQTGCRAVERIVSQPPATIRGNVTCGTPGSGGWCRGNADLSLSGSEPLEGYNVLALEGTQDGATFACPGDSCDVPLAEGGNDFSFWAVSSYGDTSDMGSASELLDSQDPSLAGSASGTPGDNGWYVSSVTVEASADDAAPGSGLASLDVQIDGGGWSGYSGPVTIGDGSHDIELRAVDGAGNSETQAFSVDVDTQAPIVDLAASPSFCPGCGELLGITIVVQDGGSGIAAWSLGASDVSVASGSVDIGETISWNGGGLGGGLRTFELEGRDAAGNTAVVTFDFNLIVPTAVPNYEDDEEAPPVLKFPRPFASPTSTTASAGPISTRTPIPTRTPVTVIFGGLPAAPEQGPSSDEDAISNLESPPTTSPLAATSGFPSPVLYGAAALALVATATAIGLDQKRRREEEEARVRAEMRAANRRAEAEEKARAVALAAAKEKAEFDLAMGQIVSQATGGAAPSVGWLAGAAAAAAEMARRLTRKEEELDPKVPPPPPPVDLAKWKQADYAAGEAWERERATRLGSQQLGAEGAFIGPIFSDRNADFNGSMSANLTIGGAPFTLDSGSPVDPKVDLGGDSAAVWAFALIVLLIKLIAVPIANALGIKRRTPNVKVQLYYSLYGENGVSVPGLVIDNQSKEPIWVDGVILTNAGGRVAQVATENGAVPSPRILPPVVEPGTSGTFHLRPADVAELYRISPHIDATVQLRAIDVPQSVKFQISSADAMRDALP